MLNIFPSLLDFSLLAPLILRVVVGVLFLRFGIHKFFKKNSPECKVYFKSLGLSDNRGFIILVGIIEVIGGLALVIGAYAQVAALVLGVISLFTYVLMKTKRVTLSHTEDFFFLLFVINLTLFITGAGVYAFDLPL